MCRLVGIGKLQHRLIILGGFVTPKRLRREEKFMSGISGVTAYGYNPYQWLSQAGTASRPRLPIQPPQPRAEACGPVDQRFVEHHHVGGGQLENQLVSAITAPSKTLKQSGNTSNLNSVNSKRLEPILPGQRDQRTSISAGSNGTGSRGSPSPSSPSPRAGRRRGAGERRRRLRDVYDGFPDRRYQPNRQHQPSRQHHEHQRNDRRTADVQFQPADFEMLIQLAGSRVS